MTEEPVSLFLRQDFPVPGNRKTRAQVPIAKKIAEILSLILFPNQPDPFDQNHQEGLFNHRLMGLLPETLTWDLWGEAWESA